MKYIITRTSTWGETKPCDEAVEETVGTETFAKSGKKSKKHIKRDFKEKRWTIEINSLEDLNKLEEKYGELIIKEPVWTCYEIPYEIEIYDDYRE